MVFKTLSLKLEQFQIQLRVSLFSSWGRKDVAAWGCGRRETVAKWCGGRKVVKCCHSSFLLWPALGQRLQVPFSLLCPLNSRMCHSWVILREHTHSSVPNLVSIQRSSRGEVDVGLYFSAWTLVCLKSATSRGENLHSPLWKWPLLSRVFWTNLGFPKLFCLIFIATIESHAQLHWHLR